VQKLKKSAVLGVSATRNELSATQRAWLWEELIKGVSLHHGACVGGDETAHDIANLIGLGIFIHPPTDEKLMMTKEKFVGHYTYQPFPYLTRNRQIVHAAHRMLFLPDGPYRLRSGTWSTARYACNLEKDGDICFPDGKVQPVSSLKGI
jgi:hypothetical protein